MKRTIAIAVLTLCMRAPESQASCAAMPSETVKIVVDKCTTVDISKMKSPDLSKRYAGILIEGSLTSGTSKPAVTKVWVPASEKLTCAQAKPKSTVSGTLGFACCDGDPNPPCLIDADSILTKITVAEPARPVKQATRAELETEVEALRAENLRLRNELESLVAREKDRAKRLSDALKGPAATKLP